METLDRMIHRDGAMNLRWLRESSTVFNLMRKMRGLAAQHLITLHQRKQPDLSGAAKQLSRAYQAARAGMIDRRIPELSQPFCFLVSSSPRSWRERHAPAVIQQAHIQNPSPAQSMTWSGRWEHKQPGSSVGDSPPPL